LNWKTKRAVVELFVDLHRFQDLEQLWAGVPRHACARFRHKVAFKSRDRDAHGFRTPELIYELDEIFADRLISLLAVTDQIHFVYRNDEVTDSQQMSDERMPPALRHDAVPRIDKNYSEICIAGARYEIARVLFVAGSVGDDELSLRRCEIAVRDVDRDALFAFGLETIGQEREVDPLAAAPFVFASRAFDLINESAFCFDQQPAYERGFSVIDVAGGREAKNVAAQK
jgi:hypothetical protein